MDEHSVPSDAAQIARRLGLSEDLVRRLQRHGMLRRFDLSDTEIQRRLSDAQLRAPADLDPGGEM
jgi:hypothetical protein